MNDSDVTIPYGPGESSVLMRVTHSGHKLTLPDPGYPGQKVHFRTTDDLASHPVTIAGALTVDGSTATQQINVNNIFGELTYFPQSFTMSPTGIAGWWQTEF
jgi:hypothetical protein